MDQIDLDIRLQGSASPSDEDSCERTSPSSSDTGASAAVRPSSPLSVGAQPVVLAPGAISASMVRRRALDHSGTPGRSGVETPAAIAASHEQVAASWHGVGAQGPQRSATLARSARPSAPPNEQLRLVFLRANSSSSSDGLGRISSSELRALGASFGLVREVLEDEHGTGLGLLFDDVRAARRAASALAGAVLISRAVPFSLALRGSLDDVGLQALAPALGRFGDLLDLHRTSTGGGVLVSYFAASAAEAAAAGLNASAEAEAAVYTSASLDGLFVTAQLIAPSPADVAALVREVVSRPLP